MLKPQAAIDFILKVTESERWRVYHHGLEYYTGTERSEGWYYAVTHCNTEPGAVSQTDYFSYDQKIAKILDETYDECDRIDNLYVEDGVLFVDVNKGNVGSGTIEDRFSLGKAA